MRDQPLFPGGAAVGLFVWDPVLLRGAGAVRVAALTQALRALDGALGGRLLVLEGDPAEVVPQVARAVGAAEVHVAADYAPYGAARDARVQRRVPLVRTGSPYAVAPGRVTKADGGRYKVFTPYFGRWLEHGWRKPARPAAVDWVDPGAVDVGGRRALGTPAATPFTVTEDAALADWARFRDGALHGYHEQRDRPDLDATSRMSAHLKFGTIHPRTMLADLDPLADQPGPAAYRRQLAWRDFYADILHQVPGSARANWDPRFDRLRCESGPAADALFAAWQQGRTGYPLVDAGMRQLLAQGWMHNRVRMVAASFLVKDLHLPWWRGARHFMDHLVDGDLANNQHGWQWVAGSGTDASPFVRVFNPTAQGQKFDPDGDYVRRWVPELRGVPGKLVHQVGGKLPCPPGYPRPVVDHAEERLDALARFEELRR